MFFLNLSLAQFAGLAAAVSGVVVALYLLDRARRRQVVSTLRFWVSAEFPAVTARRRRLQQPVSLLLQILGLLLLLLAIAQPRFGSSGPAPRDHILLLDTSAWMGSQVAARAGAAPATLMDGARQRAFAWVRSLPARDRILVIRADALATPATVFETDRKVTGDAISASRPGSTALNLTQAIAFARQTLSLSGRSRGEVVYVGPGRVTGPAQVESAAAPGAAPLRFVPVPDSIENAGLKKIGVRRSSTNAAAWDVLVSVKNYSDAPRNATIALAFGGSPLGSRQLALPPGAEKEAAFECRTRAAGLLEARLLGRDSFAADDRAVFELPSEEPLKVIVYSDRAELLRTVLESNPRLKADFRATSTYDASAAGGPVILDRFAPRVAPKVDSIWVDPPAGAPLAIKGRTPGGQPVRWIGGHPLAAGLRSQDLLLPPSSFFAAQPGDLRIAESGDGAVVVARPGPPKMVLLGFHPGEGSLRFELMTPLLIANSMRWLRPELFRDLEFSGGSAGTVNVGLDQELPRSEVRVTRDDGTELPFSLRGRSVEFFSASAGVVRIQAGARELVYSQSLPEMFETVWTPPVGVRRGVPPARPFTKPSGEWWPWFAAAGALVLLLEWVLYGRARRFLRMGVFGGPSAALRRAS